MKRLWVYSLVMAVSIAASVPMHASQAALRGKALYSREQEQAYVPYSTSIAQADALARQYKLGAAQASYQALMAKNRAEALNGFGKVAYYQTASSATWRRGEREDQIEKARQYFEGALLIKPNYAEARLNLGKMQLELDQLEEAETNFTKVLEMRGLTYPLQAEANLRLGEVLLEKQQVNDALPYLEIAAQMIPTNAAARYYLSKAYTQRGEYDKAYEQLQSGLHSAPEHPKLYEQLGLLHEQTGNLSAAITAYQKVLSLKPQLNEASDHLIAQYEGQGDLDLALAHLKSQFAKANDKPVPYQAILANRVGILALKNRQPDLAKRYFEYASKAGDANTQAQAAKGISESELQLAKSAYQPLVNDTEGTYQARTALSNSLEANPDNLKAQRLRLDMEAMQKPDGFHSVSYSKTQYQNTLNHVGTSPAELFSQGEMLVDRYQYQLADKRLALAVQSVTVPSDAMTLGDMMLKLGLLKNADMAYVRASQLGGVQPVATLGQERVSQARLQSSQSLAQAQYWIKKEKQNPQIEQALLSAMRLDQQNPVIHQELAEFYEKQKQNDPAIDHYFAYLQLEPNSPEREKIIKKMAKLSKKPK